MTNTIGVLRIGHSTRDPDERVREWASDTGLPGTACIEYAALVDNPAAVQQSVHAHLSEYRERGEWFKCDIPAAVMAIHKSAEVLQEDDRAKAREEAKMREAEKRARLEDVVWHEHVERARIEGKRGREVEQREAYEQKLAEWKRQDKAPKSAGNRTFGAICIAMLDLIFRRPPLALSLPVILAALAGITTGNAGTAVAVLFITLIMTVAWLYVFRCPNCRKYNLQIARLPHSTPSEVEFRCKSCGYQMRAPHGDASSG